MTTLVGIIALPADAGGRLTRMECTDAGWRIENQFGQGLSVIVKTLFEDRDADLDTPS